MSTEIEILSVPAPGSTTTANPQLPPRKKQKRGGLKTLIFVYFIAGASACNSQNTPYTPTPIKLYVTYPEPNDRNPHGFDAYILTLLRLALENSGHPFELNAVKRPGFGETRSENFLQMREYNLHWLNTNPHREKLLRPIRVPLFRGLIGWRLALVKQGDERQFEHTYNLTHLSRFKAGQGHNWPDNPILRRNGIPLQLSASWEGLFKMLDQGRIDYFPRSVIEIWDEQSLPLAGGLTVEPNIVLHYRAAYYFFTRRDSPELATALENGLYAAIANGDFERTFNQFYGRAIQRSQLDTRRIIALERSDLNFPVADVLWYKPPESE